MIRNYLKIAWRNLLKNRTFSIINIAGLAIGMAACIVIMLFVFYEKNVDGMHKKNIYRLCEVQKWEGMLAPQQVALSMYPMATALQKDFPEVKNFTRVKTIDNVDLNYGEKRIFVPKLFTVDSTFFNIFDFQLVQGDRKTALRDRGSVVLSVSMAQKLFGKEDPIGKVVKKMVGDTLPLKVTGVIALPENSHLKFDALVPLNTTYNPRWEQNWGGNWLVTYLELAPHTDQAKLEAKFPDFLKRHMSGDNWKGYELFLQPLADVHAGSTQITHDYINYQKFDRRYTYIFSIIAAIILIIACINFMNLSTARSAERAREVGIRKSIGAHRFQLAWQFMGESVMLSLIALVLGICIVKLTLPWIADFSNRPLELPFFSHIPQLLLILAGTIVVGILAGLYPAAYLSSFEPVKVLKGSVQTGRNKGAMRNILVVMQFTGAVFLIIATLFALKQLRYMQTKDRGFNGDQVMLLPLDGETYKKYEPLKQQLLANSLISAVTASQQRLGNNIHQGGLIYHGTKEAKSLAISSVVVDPDYLRTYKIGMIAGSNFSKDKTENGREYIINESLAKKLLAEDSTIDAPMTSLIGKMFGYGGVDSIGRIIGISKDFNFNTLHHKIETLAMYSQVEWGFSEMSIKINGNKAKEAIAFVEKIWNANTVGHPFTYTFLDQHFEDIYRADAQVSRIVGILAALAIIISCLGLFGLASFAAERRIREIGIRKVLGATVENIVTMLSKDFVRLVLLANLIAWPIAYFSVLRWLDDFAYHVDVSAWIFLGAGAAAILIALLTVSYQAIKAGLSNPVKSLRTE